MQKVVLYGIIAAVVVAGGIGIAFAAMSMNNSNAPAQPAVATEQSFSDSDVRVIQHDMGETTITGTPERIVTMSQVAYGILLELGVQPVGADLWQKGSPQNPEDPVYWEQYFPGIAEEWPDTVNVGNSGEPNLEVIASLEPDLILDSDWALGKNYDDLNAIAPTIAFFRNAELASGVTPLDQLERHTMGIADTLNRHDEGVAMVERMNANFAEEKAKLQAAGLAGEKFLFLQMFAADSIFALTPDSRQSYTIEALGLKNALPGEDFVEGGRIAIGLEQLAELDSPDLHVIYIYYGQDPVPTLEDNPVWNQLSFVQDGRIYTVGTPPPEPAVDIWGGPQTTIQFVDKVVEVMTSSAGTRTISHAMDETMITGTPERIVVVSTPNLADLLALGVQPVGSAFADYYRENYPKTIGMSVSDDVIDVGSESEPNLEIIAQLEPDLIIANTSVHTELYEELSSIAPTLMFNEFPEGNAVEIKKQNFMKLADVLNRHNQGIAAVDAMEAKFEDAAAKIQAAGLAGKKFIFFRSFPDFDALQVLLENSKTSGLLNEIGLQNAVSGVPEAAYFGGNFVNWSLENLAAIDDSDTIILNVAPTPESYADTLYADNPVWNNLEMVKEGNVYRIGYYDHPGEFPAFGVFVDRIVEGLTAADGNSNN